MVVPLSPGGGMPGRPLLVDLGAPDSERSRARQCESIYDHIASPLIVQSSQTGASQSHTMGPSQMWANDSPLTGRGCRGIEAAIGECHPQDEGVPGEHG